MFVLVVVLVKNEKRGLQGGGGSRTGRLFTSTNTDTFTALLRGFPCLTPCGVPVTTAALKEF